MKGSDKKENKKEENSFLSLIQKYGEYTLELGMGVAIIGVTAAIIFRAYREQRDSSKIDPFYESSDIPKETRYLS